MKPANDYKTSDKGRIEPLKDGPLKVTAIDRIIDVDGSPLPGGRILLCRCGHSSRKPFCDGSHADTGYRSNKLEGRLPDRVRDCAGKSITIHDNRGVCSHAEHCVRDLPSVFDRSARPWINPDGAPPDDIIRTIEKCPSGALSHTRDGVLHTDLDRDPAIRVDPGGPYEVVGGPELADPDGCRPESREHYTLCRCGASKNNPFCDGSHWHVHFDEERGGQ